MNKLLLSVATTVAVVGGTALAASIPIHVSTTTYKPGTPASMTYKGSPDEVGQSPSVGTNTANTPAPASTSASGTAASPTSSQMGPTQPAIPGATTPKQNQTPLQQVWENLYHIPLSQVVVSYSQAVQGIRIGSMSYQSRSMPEDWATSYLSPHVVNLASTQDWFNGFTFTVNPSWHVIQDSSGNVILGNGNGQGVNVNIMPGRSFGTYWSYDQTHVTALLNQLYGVPSQGWSPKVVEQYGNNHNASWWQPSSTGKKSLAYYKFWLAPTHQQGIVLITHQGLYTAVFTNYPASQ